MNSHRLSPAQYKNAQAKALMFRQRIERLSQGHGFVQLFRLAANQIEQDVDDFCDRADQLLDEAEAYGREPILDDDWLSELTGEKDAFYFSTENLLSEPGRLPRGQRSERNRVKPNEEKITQEVQQAVQNLEMVLDVAHGENVEAWIEAIATSLEKTQQRKTTFWHIQKLTQLSPTDLFLGLLLGYEHWQITQSHFYGQITVRLKTKTEIENEFSIE